LPSAGNSDEGSAATTKVIAEVTAPPLRTRRGRNAARGLKARPDTFIFQTLGYVEGQDGDLRAIVADGSEVYLVRQGDTFAGQYQVTSVDQLLVLAVKVLASPGAEDLPVSAQAEPSESSASKKLSESATLPLLARAKVQDAHQVVGTGSASATDVGMNLLNSSLAGFDSQSQF
jgi:hypothetical protein